RPGDVLRDIRIVMKEKDKGQALYGKILTQNGEPLENPQALVVFEAFQMTKENPYDRQGARHGARVEPDGSYRIEGLRPGPFQLSIAPDIPPILEDIVLPPPVTYSHQDIELEMPEGVDSMRYDVVLVENTYIHGRVLGEDLKPLGTRSTLVRALAEKGHPEIANLNSDGYFVLYVSPGNEYDLEVLDGLARETYSPKFEKIKPPVENLIMQVKTKKTEE
ncbi:MAG: carboxypeptidase-like regulatory domain-containing protein, partial [bacterium]